jgi:hypothetical protein
MAQGTQAAPLPTLAQAIARHSPPARSALSAQLGRGSAMKKNRELSPSVSCFDVAYIRWRVEFAPFEANCFNALCEFVRVHFDNVIDHYYGEGHESLNAFPAWAFERYLWEVAP